MRDFYLARQPILNRDRSIAAYELLYRSAGAGPANVTDDLFSTASVIAHTSLLGMESVIGPVRAFVNLDSAALRCDFIQFLPKDRVVLEILETVEATDQIIARVAELRDAGYMLALDDVTSDSDDVARLAELVDIVKIDILDTPRSDLPRLCGQFKSMNKKLLAEKVETLEQFQHYLQLGFDYFQGYYFGRPIVLTGQKSVLPIDATGRLLFQNVIPWCMSSPGANAVEVARNIERELALETMLLRLTDAPEGVEQALAILGCQQLLHWLMILIHAEDL